MTIAEKIRQRREELGYSQKKLASMTEITNTSISNIEKGQSFNIQSLERICKALKMRIELVPEDNNHKGCDVIINADELDYDMRLCCHQLDRVKKTLQELMK